MAPRFIARQLSRPSGFIGVAIRHLMNRHNARMNAFAIQQLQLEPADRVLEIGFGGGVTLPALLNAAAFTAGVDRSSDVIDWAQRHFDKAIKAGRAEFRKAMSNRSRSKGRRLTRPAPSTRFISGRHSMQALPRSTAFSNRAAASLSAFSRRSAWTVWECLRIFSRRAHRAMSSRRLRKRDFATHEFERPEPKTPWNVIVAAKAAPPN